MQRVLVVSKTHLDVGFTDLARQVRQRYLDDFFPRAIAVAAELRARGGPERLRWTTGSWILAEALDAEARAGRRDVERAVVAGDLCWHALPFTTHTEYCERSLFAHGLTIAAELDDRFGHRTHAAKMTDVPGHTRGLVSVLADAAVDFLHIGVNPASTAPGVPELFRWQDPAAVGLRGGEPAPELLVMYQHGSYGDVQVLPGGTTAVALDLTGDNLGPRDATDVLTRWAALSQRFPGAELRAATLDDVADAVADVRDALGVVTSEIGDTWIQGVGTDPRKTAGFRALCRARRDWLDRGLVTADDPVLRAASTELLLVAEHTWGLDLKTHWPDEVHWSASALQDVRDEPSTVRFEESWAEQRAYLDRVVEVLRDGGRDDLADSAVLARGATEVTEPFVGDLELQAPTGRRAREAPAALEEPEAPEVLEVGGFRIRLAADGSVAELVTPAGRALVDDAPLARLWVQTFDAADVERRFATYNGVTAPEDQWWARWDNTKPGLEHTGAVSRSWHPTVRHTWAGTREGMAVVVSELSFDVDGEQDPVAAPARVFLTVRAVHRHPVTTVEFDLSCFATPAARWPGATWWSFAPAVGDPSGWAMEKLGERVSPLDVVARGGRSLHCADRVAHAGDRVAMELVDTSLVAPGAPRLLDWDDELPDLSDGWHVCLHDNVWGTNFPMWTEGDARFRVVLTAG